MATARNGEVELYYEIHGDGPPLLLIHGLGNSVNGWYKQLPDLARDFRVIAFDNRGVGRSTLVTEPYTVHDMATDTLAVLDAAGVDRAHMLGVSLGGFVAQSLAGRFPDRVDRLVLGATHPGPPDALPIAPDVVAVLTDPGEGLSAEEKIRRNATLSFRPGWVEEHPDAFDELIAIRIKDEQPFEAYLAQATAGATADLGDVHPKITAPTLIVHGTEDRVVPVGNAHLLAEKIAGARLELLEGAGHILIIEDPEWFNGVVRSFLLSAGERSG